MKIALAQMNIDVNIRKNLKKTLQFMDDAEGKGAQLICFPELQFSPFFPQYSKKDVSDYAFTIEHESIKLLREKCKRLNLVAVPNFYLKENDNHYDASPVIDSNGEILGISKMVHILQIPHFYEQDYYTPSDSGFKVYKTAIGNVGVVICYDRHYPESIRSCVLRAAELIIIPTAIVKGEPLEKFEWEIRIAAMQNNVFIAMCNRTGIEEEMDFCGTSTVVDPNGDIIVKADYKEQIVYADIDFSKIQEIRKQRPYLRLRKPESFSEIYDPGFVSQNIT